MANTYYFIDECSIDTERARKIFKDKGKIRKSKIKHSTWHYNEEFECFCGHEVYELKTDLSLEVVKEMILKGVDLHYIYMSINTFDNFDK